MKVLLTEPIADEGLALLLQAGVEVVCAPDTNPRTLQEFVRDVDGMIVRAAKISADIMEAAERLRVIGRYGIGVDNIDLEAARRFGITVVNVPKANTNAVAEYVMGAVLLFAKKFFLFNQKVRQGNWHARRQLTCMELEEKIIGIIGFGTIGRAVARKAVNGFGMHVLAYDPFINGVKMEGVELCNHLEDVLRQSDFVTIHLPLTDSTRGLINFDRLKTMKKTAYLINTARGSVVDERDLYQAISENVIAGACLDVFTQEPPRAENPLFSLDNVFLTPHVAGLTDLSEKCIALTVAEDVLTCLRGDRPQNVVDISNLGS